jgi:tRNA threonylcarbamoyladenosine biosynthesis protein TsaE
VLKLPFLTARTRSAEETRGLGQALGELVAPGDVVLLMGDLGSGKTTFVQGFARGLGVPDTATSPSYTLMHQYEGRYPMLHVDLFRCGRAQEVIDLGLEEMLEPPWVVAIEWGEKAAPLVAADFLEIEFHWDESDEDSRTIQFRPYGRWRDKMRILTDAVRGWVAEAG